ncbi:MAG: ABC transporter ATP-binding protein [Myxococcales bacterium]|nr:ABC transporter ATP-binding protein [Myxococcales bacterium]
MEPESNQPAVPDPRAASEVPSGETPCIVVTGLRKRFSDGEVLRGIDLVIRRGELVGFTGRSGSGKSTLLHILGGLDRGYEGKVSLLGQDLATLSDRALANLRNRHIGFVFQAFHLLTHLSCLDNVLLPNAFAQEPLGRMQAEERAMAALTRVGLADRRHSRPSELSGGQKQRVAIARALLFQPEVLLCDEPTGNLDDFTGQQIIDLFVELNRDGLTMVLVTHEPRVAQATTRLLSLQNGLMVPPQSLEPSR